MQHSVQSTSSCCYLSPLSFLLRLVLWKSCRPLLLFSTPQKLNYWSPTACLESRRTKKGPAKGKPGPSCATLWYHREWHRPLPPPRTRQLTLIREKGSFLWGLFYYFCTMNSREIEEEKGSLARPSAGAEPGWVQPHYQPRLGVNRPEKKDLGLLSMAGGLELHDLERCLPTQSIL